MSLRTTTGRVIALLLVSSALACEALTGPDDIVAEYALVSLASQALPTAPAGGSGPFIIADTLRLRADGTGERTLRSASSAFGIVRIDRDAFTWRTEDGLLQVSFPCDDTAFASCIAPPHLSGSILSGMQWVIPRARIFNDDPAVYQRVGMR